MAENHEHLQHCIVATDAASRSASERQMSEGLAQPFVGFAEAFRLETLWALPVARRMMRSIHIDNDRRSSGYVDLPSAVVGDGHAVDHPKRRLEAESLLNDLSSEFEPGNIRVTQRHVAQHGIELLPDPFETIRTRAQ